MQPCQYLTLFSLCVEQFFTPDENLSHNCQGLNVGDTLFTSSSFSFPGFIIIMPDEEFREAVTLLK